MAWAYLRAALYTKVPGSLEALMINAGASQQSGNLSASKRVLQGIHQKSYHILRLCLASRMEASGDACVSMLAHLEALSVKHPISLNLGRIHLQGWRERRQALPSPVQAAAVH